MEFMEFLDRTEVEILRMIEKAGYKTAENTKLCMLSDNYVGFFNKSKKKIIICTSNAKKRGGYTPIKNKNSYERTALHIKKALRHEAVHVAQECNDGKLLKIDKNLSMKKSKIKALNGSLKISGMDEEQKEIQAYILEDRPKIVREKLKKYCL